MILIPDKLSGRLASFLSLQEGWHFGEGDKISQAAVGKARRLLISAYANNPAVETNVFPGIDGEVRVCLYIGNKDWEFTIEKTDRIIFRIEENGIEVSAATELNMSGALEKISLIKPAPCLSLDLFPSSIIMIPKGGELTALPFAALATAESRWWTRTVSLQDQLPFVATFKSIMLPSSKDSSSASAPINYLPATP